MIYPFARIFLCPIYRLWLRKVEGMEHIPIGIPFIIAANHTSYYDTLLPAILIIPNTEKYVHALVNSRYWNHFLSRLIIDWGHSIPVYVGKANDPIKNKESLKKALSFLKQGHLIQIFPEGTRSPDGKIQKGKTGIARLALAAQVPVLPIGIIGSNKVWPKGNTIKFKRCEVKIGKPMDFSKYYKNKRNEKAFDEVTRTIMKGIANLIGQKYNY